MVRIILEIKEIHYLTYVHLFPREFEDNQNANRLSIKISPNIVLARNILTVYTRSYIPCNLEL